MGKKPKRDKKTVFGHDPLTEAEVTQEINWKYDPLAAPEKSYEYKPLSKESVDELWEYLSSDQGKEDVKNMEPKAISALASWSSSYTYSINPDLDNMQKATIIEIINLLDAYDAKGKLDILGEVYDSISEYYKKNAKEAARERDLFCGESSGLDFISGTEEAYKR